MPTLDFSSGTKVGLVVRGKQSAAHSPGLMEQHADCILPGGAPVGFFGDGPGWSGRGASTGMGMDGRVYYYPQFQAHRPFYVDANEAKRYSVVSTVLEVSVSPEEARRFVAAWAEMARNPGTFNLLGGNCATHASLAFVHAGIVSGGIPGLDTPNNLYNQLAASRGGGSHSGYVGFTPAGSGYTVAVDPAK